MPLTEAQMNYNRAHRITQSVVEREWPVEVQIPHSPLRNLTNSASSVSYFLQFGFLLESMVAMITSLTLGYIYAVGDLYSQRMTAASGNSFGLILLSLGLLRSCNGDSILEGVDIQSECRDRYFWVHVRSPGIAPQFEAIDEAGVHPIDEKADAPRCGYTVSNFNMDGYTTLRASYFSCYTDNQDDEVFAFQFQITVTDSEGRQSRYPLAQTCALPLPWSQREVICEEDYMEVTVGRDVLCSTSEGTSKEGWERAHSVAQKTASSIWQVMFLKNKENVAAVSATEAQQLGYELRATTTRVVFRSPYGQTHAALETVDGVAVEVIHGTVFFRQNMMVVMIDISVACTRNPGSFDGARLLWDIPRVMTPLVQNNSGFESKQINVGVESQLLDEGTARARGYTLEVKGPMLQLGVPFGAEGGYTTSLVLNNVYQEVYIAFLFYEHVFSHIYADGSTIETRHRLCRLIETPMLCQKPFTVDILPPDQATGVKEYAFNVYLGNIPDDVVLVTTKLNGNQFSVAEAAERGYAISEVVHANGTRGYTLRVPFDDKSVDRMYLGQGLLQYSMDINYTLSIMPQEDSYYHLASAVETLSDAFPPEAKGVCIQSGIIFDLDQPRLGYVWEISVGHDRLTPELVAERGYNLQNDSHSLTLEVPRFTAGYTYKDINLRHFYGIFEVLSRDSQTLEIQTSTATRCHFRTDELIICSSDGTMTVVTKTTWPGVAPESTTLLDRTCQPKETDDSRVLFEFGLKTCGTRFTVEESYVVYENEILSNSEVLPEKDPLISRNYLFRLPVRCVYPLNSVGTPFMDRIFKSEVPGVGSMQYPGNIKDVATNEPVPGCQRQVPNYTENIQTMEKQPLSHHSETGENYNTNYESSAAKSLNPPPNYDRSCTIGSAQ
ncbi:hypothetical protein UPYG_G00253210 [Umbra pygmaea]|uniref:ZP domain-containing protein n=1 Tax=Umbra pygmaea TaxID=75934 RepID=A0ABD0WXX0_UMBPY